MNDMQQQFLEAGALMLAGMVFVFAFLSVLIIFINTILAPLAVKFPDPVVKSKRSNNQNNKSTMGADEVSPAIVAAISTAVSRYRKQHSQQN